MGKNNITLVKELEVEVMFLFLGRRSIGAHNNTLTPQYTSLENMWKNLETGLNQVSTVLMCKH